MNAFIRCKLALTEETPTVKPYEESEWAKFPDADSRTDVQVSVQLLAALHARWTAVLKSIHGGVPGSVRIFIRGRNAHLRWKKWSTCMPGMGEITWRTCMS
jgi:hypothetical protein